LWRKFACTTALTSILGSNGDMGCRFPALAMMIKYLHKMTQIPYMSDCAPIFYHTFESSLLANTQNESLVLQ
jgi:hypothetical protein